MLMDPSSRIPPSYIILSLFHRCQHPVLFTGGYATCQICGAAYASRDSLVKHMKMHSGETRCPHCHLRYARMYHLRQHMMAVHGMSKEEVARVTRVTNKREFHVQY